MCKIKVLLAAWSGLDTQLELSKIFKPRKKQSMERLVALQANVRSFTSVLRGKIDALTADEKRTLGLAAGVVTVVLATVYYRSFSTSTTTSTTTTSTTATTTPSKKFSASVTDSASAKGVEPTSLATPSHTSKDATATTNNTTLNKAGLTTSEQVRLAASPSSDEDPVGTGTPTSATTTHHSTTTPTSTSAPAPPPITTTTTTSSPSSALEVERRIQAEFDAAPVSSTTGDDQSGDSSSEYDSEEEEEEQRMLELPQAVQLMHELLEALDKFHDNRMVEVYGSFVSCLISMQKVFQRFDWGYAEWPDVVAVLDAHSGTEEYDAVWSQLQLKLSSLNFPNIPIFKNDLSKVELLKIMEEMLGASKQVADSVRNLKTTGDPIIDAHHNFNEKKTRESYEQWRKLCDVEEFATIATAATFPNEREVKVAKSILKEWKDAYLVRVMLNMMTPLTQLQEDNMRTYGIGATHFQHQVWKYGNDSEVANVKRQLEFMMTQIHPAASDTETTGSGSSGSDIDN